MCYKKHVKEITGPKYFRKPGDGQGLFWYFPMHSGNLNFILSKAQEPAQLNIIFR